MDPKTLALYACLVQASAHYQLPPDALYGIWQVERGPVGVAVGPNRNGSYDLGPMQINTIWLPQLAQLWGVGQSHARKAVLHNGCLNMYVGAWILRGHYNQTRDIWRAIARYHSATPHIGRRYLTKVVSALRRAGRLRTVTNPDLRVAQR